MANYKDDKVFCKIVNLVVNTEGGFVDDPMDSGGATKYGVAFNYNKKELKELFNITKPEQMRDLTPDQAKQLYYHKYYAGSGAAGLSDVDLAYIHFDAAVNQGIGWAKKALGSLSKNPFWYDGSGGKNRLLFMGLFLEYVAKRLDRYTDLNLSLRKRYLSGWVNRIVDVINNANEVLE